MHLERVMTGFILCTAIAGTSKAITYFPSNATISTALTDAAIIGQDGNGGNTSPTVTITSTGSVSTDVALYNSSRVDYDGTIGRDVLLFDNSRFESRSTAQAIAGRLFVRGTCDATLNSTLNGSAYVEQSGKLVVGASGFIGGGLTVSGSGKATITSGRVRGALVGNITQSPVPPAMDVFGGVIEEGIAVVSVATNRQGNPPTNITFHGNADLFFETETTNYNDPAFPGRSMQLHFVSGTLADGTLLRFFPVKIENGTNAQIVITPEPASLTMLGLVMPLLARRRV